MTAVSILKRWGPGIRDEQVRSRHVDGLLVGHHYVQCGEENRHNAEGSHSPGYGHIMLLNIRNVVEPVSRGLLVDAFDPDYPPLSYACDDTHRQGGVVIWCHNGRGMEAPRGRRLGQDRRLQPLRPELDGPRVRHLLQDAERRHQAARIDRFRLVHKLGQPGLCGHRRGLRVRGMARSAEGGPDVHHQRPGAVTDGAGRAAGGRGRGEAWRGPVGPCNVGLTTTRSAGSRSSSTARPVPGSRSRTARPGAAWRPT